jgi:predicted RecA/RadA family phage recombinase
MKNSVQDGRVLTFTESDLTHPSHSDGLVDAGDPVVVGRVVGVAYENAAASSDSINVQTEGVFDLSVSSVHNGISKGETVFIDPSTAALSDDYADVPFGVALETVSAGQSDTINVKLFGQTPGTSLGANS